MSKKNYNSIFFIGGGNMANAIIGGMDRTKWSRICVAEVSGGARRSLEEKFQIETVSNADHPSIIVCLTSFIMFVIHFSSSRLTTRNLMLFYLP